MFSSFCGLFQGQIVEARDLVEDFERRAGLVLDFFFGQLLVIELDDFFDRARAGAQILGDGHHFLDHDRGARNGFQNQQLPALDALGDGDFTFARKQGDGAHLAQVHAHGIVGFLEESRSEVELNFITRADAANFFFNLGFARFTDFEGGARYLGGRRILVDIDAVAFKGREKIVNFFRGVHFRGQNIVYFVIQQVAALLAHVDELPYLIVFFFKSQCQGFLRPF